jgi:molecular chaperone DnaK
MSQQKIIGIDLGTTNSCVAVIEGGKPVVIPNQEGYRTTPSVVAFTQTGDRQVGLIAKRQAVTNPTRTIHSIKRHMGTRHLVNIEQDYYSPEQISAYILQRLKTQAETYLGEKVSKAIITVPAYFDDAQRLATRDAGQIAGLEVVRIINEPTACALTYGFAKPGQEATIIIFDFGGGTFDVTILHLSDQVLEVRATSGNNRLGGDDFDQRVIEWLRKRFMETHGVDLSKDPMAMQRLKEAAEQAKIELSGRTTATIHLPFLTVHQGQPLHLETELTAAEFNQITADLVKATAKPIETALADAKIKVEQIDYVILAGGTTRIPAIQSFIREYFNKEPVKSVNPDEAIALGAAIQGGVLSGEVQEVLLLDVIPMTLWAEHENGDTEKLFDRNTTLPTGRSVSFKPANSGQKNIHVHVVQGEASVASLNKSLARFDLPLRSPGDAPVSVAFDIDVDGIFCCTAIYSSDAKKFSVDLKRTNGLSREDLQKLTKAAQAQAEAEQLEQERVSARVMAESCIADAERTVQKYLDKIPDEQSNAVRGVINQLRAAMAAGYVEEMEFLSEKLEITVMHCIKAASR